MGIADGIGSFGGKQLCFAVERVHVGRYLNILAVGAAYHAECVIFKCITLVKGDHGGPAIIDLSVDPIWPQWEQEMAQYTTPDEMRAAFIMRNV